MRGMGLHALTATVAIGAAMALSFQGVALAGGQGMKETSRMTVRAIVNEVGLSVKTRCVDADRSKSDRTWAAYFGSSKPGCTGLDGYTVVHRSRGSWRALPIGGSYVPCSDLEAKLASAGASKAVFRDFQAGGYCQRGE